MEHINKTAVNELMESSRGQVVTIYIPMHVSSSPPHMSEDQIRFKNLIHKATAGLDDSESSQQLAKELEQKHAELREDTEFWKHQTPGLLICAQAGMLRMFHLPIDTEEYVSVDDKFYLAPILGLVNDEHEYYVLTVTQQNPQLFKGDSYGLRPTGLELPTSAEQALNIDENNRKTENQGSASGSSLNTGWFNGRGGARNPQEEDRHQYFRIIDHMVSRHIRNNSPLILAGIDAEIVEYTSLSKYTQILNSSISGSHSGDSSHDLFSQAYAIVQQEIIEPAHAAAIEDYEHMHGANPERVATDKKSITEAAEQGRIDKLLVRMARKTTDTIRDTIDATTRITFPEPEASKSLNDLAAKVWQMSGSVVGLQANQMPHGASMVARLRY